MSVGFKNRPSPRPGFTYVARERAKSEGPVVVVVSGAPTYTTALQRAASEAGMRSVPLHVLVVDSSSVGEGEPRPNGTDDARHRAVGLSVLNNPNVTVSHIDLSDTADEDVSDYCSSHGASLLVVDHGYYAHASRPGEPLDDLRHETADLAYDVLIVHSPHHG